MQSEGRGFILQWATPPLKAFKRPYTIERDVQKLEQSQVVTKALKSGTFKGELENLLQGMVGGRPNPARSHALKKLQENVVPASKIEAAKQAQLPHVITAGVNPAIIPINDLRGASASKYSVAERQLRCRVAAMYRILEKMGWDEVIYNHVTARSPGEEEHFLLNPFGLHFSEITASSLVRVDLNGTIIDPGSTQLGINSAGYFIHSAIHQARKDVKCIIHIHTRAGAAVSTMKCGLLPISQEAMTVGSVSYHDYRGIVCTEEEKKELARDLGPVNMVMILRNHGLLALGRTVEEAFHFAYSLVYACEIQVSALVAGLSNLVCVDRGVQQQVFEVGNRVSGGVGCHLTYGPGELEFEALMRMLDNQGYCTGYPYKAMHLLLPEPHVSKPVLTPGGAGELRKEARRQRREKIKQKLQQKLREIEEQEKEDLSSEGQHSLAAPTAVVESESAMAGQAPDVLEPRILHQAPATASLDKATIDHAVPLAHLVAPSSEDNGLWRFLEKKKANRGDSASSRVPFKDSGSAPPGKESPGDPAPTHNHDKERLVNLDALLRAEKTAQVVAASTSAAVERLSNSHQLEHAGIHAVNGLSSATGALSSSASTQPYHQKHFFASSSPDNSRQRVAFGNISMEEREEEEEEVDLGAVQKAQLTARRVAQSTTSAVEKLTQS